MNDIPHCSSSAGHVSCKDCADFLMDYLDNVLPPEERRKFDAHLALCRDCVVYLENYRKTVAMTCAKQPEAKECREVQIPRRLVDAILAARKPKT